MAPLIMVSTVSSITRWVSSIFVHLCLGFSLLIALHICDFLCLSSASPSSHVDSTLHHNHRWLPATATWYGSSNGDGSDGGACGYGNLAATPYGMRISAGSPVLFRNGEGCGACYQVRCLDERLCSQRKGVTVVITDECPGGYCAFGRTHFDMSGTAFAHMAASPRLSGALLNVGELSVVYRRVPCNYGHGVDVAFEVNQGATNFWFSMLVKYEDGDGDLSQVELMEGQSGQWVEMKQLWGAYWCLNGGPLVGPFSVRITTSTGSKLTALNAIPSDWAPGQLYNTRVNFP